MNEISRNTIAEENKYRSSMRRTFLTVGTPILAIVLIGIAIALITIISTFSAAKKFNSATSLEDIDKVVEQINISAYTSQFIEGYKAKYNYATVIALTQPENAVNLYATEILPISPPEFICYPILNGVYYSTLLGDQAMQITNYLEAEHYYNYAEFFMASGPQCFSGGGSSSEEQEDESEGNESGSEGSESEYEEKREELKDKQNEARKAQGKDPRDDKQNEGRPTDKQKSDLEDSSNSSQKEQRDTQDVRDAERNQDAPVFTDKPW